MEEAVNAGGATAVVLVHDSVGHKHKVKFAQLVQFPFLSLSEFVSQHACTSD